MTVGFSEKRAYGAPLKPRDDICNLFPNIEVSFCFTRGRPIAPVLSDFKDPEPQLCLIDSRT